MSSARSRCGAAGTRRRGRLARGAPWPTRGAHRDRHLTREPCPRPRPCALRSVCRGVALRLISALLPNRPHNGLDRRTDPRSHRAARYTAARPFGTATANPIRLAHRALPLDAQLCRRTKSSSPKCDLSARLYRRRRTTPIS